MRLILIGLLTLLFVTFLPVFAEDNMRIKVVYPQNGATVNASSVFFVGNTNPGANLTINNKAAKVYPNGAFVEVVDLSKGENYVSLKSSLGHAVKETVYKLNVPKQENYGTSPAVPIPVSAIAQITKDYAVTRKTPDGDRLTPLPAGTMLNITGKLGDSYRFKYSDSMVGWISKNDVQVLPDKNNLSENVISSINFISDENYLYIKIPFSKKLPFLISQNEANQINFKFYNTKTNTDWTYFNKSKGFIEELRWNYEPNGSLNFSLKANSRQLWGYKYYYEGNILVLKLRKPPQINPFKPLDGKTICIDPGHGGKEPGSVGPTEVPEKQINMAISNKVKEMLENKGAKVIMTRTSDKYVGLFDRVDIANQNEAQIILSIHNNALPDGKNPYEEHGTSTYYYHPQSFPLAKNLQDTLVGFTRFKDLGVFNRSFVLTRPSEALSVLVEVGFMIHPEEYSLLLTPDFQEKAAEGIVKGLENFYLSQI